VTIKRRLDWMIGFIALMHSATSTYNAIADLHVLQLTRAHAKSSQSAFTSRFLVTDTNNGDSSASVVTLLPAGYYFEKNKW
jgi:hypothetical protein